MTDPKHSQHQDAPLEGEVPEYLPTVDLTMEEFDDAVDLDAVAAEMEDYNPDLGTPVPNGAPKGPMAVALAQASARIEALEKADAEHKDRHHRLLADFNNHRNRVGRDTQLAVSLAERKLLVEILPVLDNLERCVNAKYNTLEDFHNGVLLIQKQMQEALRKAGVEPLEINVGDPFDAQHAEALTTTQQAGLPDGSVAAIFERGYMLRDQLMRPARVIVNHNPDADSTQNPS